MKTYTITGRVIDEKTKKGIPNLRVEAWDKDLLFDDFLGESKTDKDGKFTIELDAARFRVHY